MRFNIFVAKIAFLFKNF